MLFRKTLKSIMLLSAVLLMGMGMANAAKGGKKAKTWNTLPMPEEPDEAKSTGYIKSGSARIYYAIYGEGKPLILLHGGLGNGDHWGGQIAEFSKYYRVITLDSRGHGRSTLGKKPLSYKLMASDVITVMDQLQLKKAAIVGWSDGGAIGLTLAIQNPDRLTKVVIFGANYHTSGIKSRGKGNTTFPSYMKKARADYVRLSRTPKQYGKFIKQLSRMWRSQPRFTSKQLKSITVPVAVTVGQYDEIIKRSHTDKMAKLIPGAQKIIMPDLSHFALWQSPQAFNKSILGFLNSASQKKKKKEELKPKDTGDKPEKSAKKNAK